MSAFSERWHGRFNALADRALAALRDDEQLNLNLVAEDTLYLRLNHNRVRQNTDVCQIDLSMTLQTQGRTVEHAITLTGDSATDASRVDAMLQSCRAEVPFLPRDAHQVPMVNNGSSHEAFSGELLSCAQLLDAVLTPAQGLDMAGLYAGGSMVRANRNSAGQTHWFASESFFLDYSLYEGPKAAKGSYAGRTWDGAQWRAHLERTREMLQLLRQPVVAVAPGQYRTYLAPRAFSDLLGMLGWNALSTAAWKQGRSPLRRLVEGECTLSPLLTLGENFGMGLSPRFNDQGEVSAVTVPFIEAGRLRQLLTSTRTAKEYGLVANAANEAEAPRALDVAPGSLAQADVLQALGTGLYLSNLHYLNWSDAMSARVTGMTRYACFWVENGKIVGPIQDLRWDESLFDALGANLLALTDQAEVDPAVDTYFARGLGGARVPGALIDKFTFTL